MATKSAPGLAQVGGGEPNEQASAGTNGAWRRAQGECMGWAMKGEAQGECPVCGSDRVAQFRLRGSDWHHACMDCKAMWEPFKAEDLLDSEDEYSSFKIPCDNCACRKDSPERQDKLKWEALIRRFEAGGTFMCHKGVPLSFKEGESHDHPKTPDGKWDMTRMRVCRGFLNMERGAERKAIRAIERLQERKA